MSVKKNFITLDSTDLFDDSDIDEEISSFLQDYESKHKPSQNSSGKEVIIGQKDVPRNDQTSSSGVKSMKEKVNSNRTTKSDPKNEQTSTSGVKSMQEKINSNQTTKSDHKDASTEKCTKTDVNGNQATENSKKSVLDEKSSKSNLMTQVVKKKSEVTGSKKHEQKKAIEGEKVHSKISGGTLTNSKSSLKDIVLDDVDLEFLITDKKDEGSKSVVEPYSCCSPVSSVSSELFDSTELEQEIQSFLGKKLLASEDRKQSGSSVKDKNSVNINAKTTVTKNVSNVKNEKVQNESVKVVHQTVKTVTSKTHSTENYQVELQKEKFEKLNCDQPKLQKENIERLETRPTKNDQIEIGSVSKEIKSKDGVKEKHSSDMNMKDKTTSGDDSAIGIPKMQEFEENFDYSLKIESKTVVNDNIATQNMQDSRKEIQQTSFSSKGKTEVNTAKSKIQDCKKEIQKSDLSNEDKTDVNTVKPGVQDSKKEIHQTNLSNKGETDVNTGKSDIQDSKKETPQTNLSNKGETDDNTGKSDIQDYKKEIQQTNLSNKGETDDNTGKSDFQHSKKETQQTNLSNKGKTEVSTGKSDMQDSIKGTQQTNLLNKGGTELSTGKSDIQDFKKETQQTNLRNKGKNEVNTAKSEVQDSKRETQQSDLSNKEKTEVKSKEPGVQDSKNDIQQLGSSEKGKTESKIAPELGIIIGDYEKEEGDKKYDSKDQELCIDHNESDETSEGTKQVNKRKLEENSESESDSKKSKKGYFTSSDYEKQLESKMADIKDKLSRSSDFIINKYSKDSTISRNILRNNGLVCDLDDMKKCPSNEWMATVCSFVIGVGRLSNDLVVGFTADNSVNKKTVNPTVKSISEVVHNYPDHVIGAAKVFEKMIQVHARGKGGRPHPHGVKKVWKELCIYTNKKQELMLIIRVSADSTLIIKEIYSLYVDFFKNGEGKKFRVASVYITCYYKIGNHDECWIEHLTGNQSLKIFRGLYVNFIGLVEPWSNMYGLKILCRAVEELLMPTRNTTVLEIFCCTGLLGHYLSKIAGEVLAYDDPDVVRSTRKNATRNKITGVQYFSGDPQSELLYRIEMARCDSLTAVINWNPNLNRHVSISLVMKILREVKKLQKLVVVATSNTLSHIPFRTLCAPYDMERGEPFFPVKAIPIDTMPLQDGYAVAVLFKRQFESVKQECSKRVSRPKVKEEWWNWIKDDESKDGWKEDDERKGENTNEERKDDDRRKKRNDDEEEKKQKLEEQMKRMIHGELRKRKEEMEKIKEEGGDRRQRRRFDDDDDDDDEEEEDNDREYVHGMWRRKKKDEKNRKIMEEERKRKMEQEDDERKRQLEEEMKKKLQEQLDKRRREEIERIQKAQEELRRKEEEERQKKEMQEKAKRLTFFRKRLKEEQRRRAQEDQKVETEKEQTEEEVIAKKKKEIEEDQKKHAQIKDKKKQLEEEERKKPLEQLRRQIEEEKVRAKKAAERKRLAQIEEKKRKVEEEERRQQLSNQRIPVWEQPPVDVGILEQRKLEEVHWRILEEEKYRRCMEEEAYRKVTVVFDYNHGGTVSSAVPKQEEAKINVESSTSVTPSNAVSRPVMKWLEKLREVSGDVDVKGKHSTGITNNNNIQQTSKATPPSLLSLHVEKPTLLPSSSDGIASGPFRPILEKPVAPPPLLSFHVEKPSSFGSTSADGNASRLLSAPIRPLLQPPGFLKVSGRDDHLPEVGRSNVSTIIRQSSSSTEPSRPLIEPFGEQQGLSSIGFGEQQSFSSKTTFSEQQGFSSIGFGEQQGISSIVFGSHKGLSSVAYGGHDNLSKGRYSFGGIGRNDAQENTAAGPRGMTDVFGSRDAPSVNNLYGFVGSGRYDDQARNSGDNLMRGIPNTGDIHSTDNFSFQKTLQEMRTYNSSYSGQGQY